MDCNVSDLSRVLAVSGAAFGLARVAVGKPLVTQVVNPHRPLWLLAAGGFLSGAAGLLRWHAKSADPEAWAVPLRALVTEERTAPQVMVAAFGLFNGLVILGLVGYCRLVLPRDPATFRGLHDAGRVVRYYARRTGGLDFAVLVRLGKEPDAVPEVVASGTARRHVAARMAEAGIDHTVDEQAAAWTAQATVLHHEMERLAKVLGAAGQGANRRALFDGQYGGVLFQYVRPPEVGDEFVYLFAATLSQREVDSRRFEDHFDLLVTALRHVRAGVEKA